MYKAGDRVECYYDNDYYPGHVHSVDASNGTYWIKFDDGDELEDAALDEIRSIAKKERPRPKKGRKLKKKNKKKEKEKDDWQMGILSAFKPFEEEYDEANHVTINSNTNVNALINDEWNGEGFDTVPSQALPPDNMAEILPHIERFLLPVHDNRYLIRRNRGVDKGLTPNHRLAFVLHEAATLEHLRIFQTLSRDSEDHLKLCPELRVDNPGAHLPTKRLISLLTEKRARALGICRTCLGERSMAMLRAHMDLAGCYALQGLWPQVADHTSVAARAIERITEDKQRRHQSLSRAHAGRQERVRALLCGELSLAVFSALRAHTVEHYGFVTPSFIPELTNTLQAVMQQRGVRLDIVALRKEASKAQNASNISSSQPMSQSTTRGGGESEAIRTLETELLALLAGLECFIAGGNGASRMLNSTAQSTAPAPAGPPGPQSPLTLKAIQRHLYSTGQAGSALAVLGMSTTTRTFYSYFGNPQQLPSWGQVISFLRPNDELADSGRGGTSSNSQGTSTTDITIDSAPRIMQTWQEALRTLALPQMFAAIDVAFQSVDPSNRGLANPSDLRTTLLDAPPTARLRGISALANYVEGCKADLRLQFVVNSSAAVATGSAPVNFRLPPELDTPLLSTATNNPDGPSGPSKPDGDQELEKDPKSLQRPTATATATAMSNERRREEMDRLLGEQPRHMVGYALPLAWDELTAAFALATADALTPEQRSVQICRLAQFHAGEIGAGEEEDELLEQLRTQLLTLDGVRLLFTGDLATAETTLQQALQCALASEARSGHHEHRSIAMCEIYNSIAQLMIMKHREWTSGRRLRAKEAADRWLASPAGQSELTSEALTLHEQEQGQTGARTTGLPSAAETSHARAMLLRTRIKHEEATEADPTRTNVEAAFRYLVHSYDLLCGTHGPEHPAIAAACLAIASVHNMAPEGLPGAIEWLRRALATMEILRPCPVRAMAFAQIQLSQVLVRAGMPAEAQQEAQAAATHYHASARDALLIRARDPYYTHSMAVNANANANESASSNANGNGNGTSNPFAKGRLIGHTPSSSRRISSSGTGAGAGGLQPQSTNPPPSVLLERYSQYAIDRALPFVAGRVAYDEVLMALDLSDRLLAMCLKHPELAVEPGPLGCAKACLPHAEAAAELAEAAFGWDSPQGAKYRQQYGERLAFAGDLNRAVSHLRRSCECHAMVFGSSHARTANAAAVFKKVARKREQVLAKRQAHIYATSGGGGGAKGGTAAGLPGTPGAPQMTSNFKAKRPSSSSGRVSTRTALNNPTGKQGASHGHDAPARPWSASNATTQRGKHRRPAGGGTGTEDPGDAGPGSPVSQSESARASDWAASQSFHGSGSLHIDPDRALDSN
jgi:hypothetical protein